MIFLRTALSAVMVFLCFFTNLYVFWLSDKIFSIFSSLESKWRCNTFLTCCFLFLILGSILPSSIKLHHLQLIMLNHLEETVMINFCSFLENIGLIKCFLFWRIQNSWEIILWRSPNQMVFVFRIHLELAGVCANHLYHAG